MSSRSRRRRTSSTAWGRTAGAASCTRSCTAGAPGGSGSSSRGRSSLLFFALPLVPVGGHPAVHLDIATRQFHVLGSTFHPTDNLLLAALGVAVIITVFFVGSTFGRLWCGYACPQTVYMEFVFRPIETSLEGRPAQQVRLNLAPWGPRKIAVKAAKWGAFAAVALLMSSRVRRLLRRLGPARPRGAGPAAPAHRHALRDRVRRRRDPVRLRLVPRPDVHAGLPLRPAAERDGRPGHHPRGLRREAGRAAGHAEAAARRGRGARGLRRLPAVRDHLPDRRRHPPRPAARVHRLRPVHRRLRHGDGPDGPPPRPHPQHVRARARRRRPALLAAPGAGLPRPPDPRLGHPRRARDHPRGRARRDPAGRPRALPPAAAGRGGEPAAHPHHQPGRRAAELHDRGPLAARGEAGAQRRPAAGRAGAARHRRAR